MVDNWVEKYRAELPKDDGMRNYCIKEYEQFLESKGIDTVCFVGYEYNFEDIKIGAEFYISYLYWTRKSDYKRSQAVNKFEDTLHGCLKQQKYQHPNIELTDKFVLIQKYKYFAANNLNNKDRTISPIKIRREHVQIKNLRSSEVMTLSDEWIDDFPLFLFDRIEPY